MHESERVPQPRIEFSIVTSVYNVARYLDEFIESIDGQTFPRDRFEVIAVDDGSTDESLAKLRAWEKRRPGLVTALTKENEGLPATRNVGMKLARGTWVTFPDPDDVLAPDYLAEVSATLEANPTASMAATNLLFLNDSTGEVTDTHPLRRRFGQTSQLRDLAQSPGHFFVSAPAAFFRLDEVRRSGLEFDARVDPNFEDGHFGARYLLGFERPTIAFVSGAHYHYRRRQDQSSTLQRSLAHPGRYTNVLRHGYIDVLHRGAEATGTGLAPEWLQNLIIYELSWYFSTQDRPAGAVTAAVGQVADEFHELMARLLEFVSPEVIEAFSSRPLKPEWREILLHGYAPTSWHATVGHVQQLDPDQGLVRVVYRYTGPSPDEELMSGDDVVAPHHAKVRDFEYHGRVLLHERIVWMSSRRSIEVRLDGVALDLRFTVPRPPLPLSPTAIQRKLEPKDARPRTLRQRLVAWVSSSRPVRRRFGGAWVLMDRVHDAGDSGEILFRYLRRSHPDINAWFVIEPGTADWQRLRSEFGGRVIPHGSRRWKLLMANCVHLVSSHADEPIVRPSGLGAIGKPRWRFTFLQHGVIKDDVAGWLNPKPIDLFVTSTPAEHASIIGDHTRYRFTTKEVKLTGMPRFDRLREIGGKVADEERTVLLVAPTWRNWLFPPLPAGTQRREVDPAALDSDFVRCWMALLESPELESACRDEGITVGFLPHPNLQPAVPRLRLPAHVRPMTFHDGDVQELFARAAMMVTDYSSMAFNVAYLDRPVVYFQFDRDRVLGGEHVGRQGYFDYDRDGFGPVATSVEEAVRAITDTLRAGRRPSVEYQARIDATFPQRDGNCCERVVEEIRRSTQLVSIAPPFPNAASR